MNILDHVYKCSFVEASKVFEDCPQAWETFVNSDPDCSWGDNNRTMVTPQTIIDVLDTADYEEDEAPQHHTVIDRLKALGETYVDLEN